MRKYIMFYCLMITSVSSVSLYGQSDIDLNHHWLWRLDHNPATIKNNGYLEIDLLGRFQWAGFTGAPRTYLASGSWFYSDINSGFAALAMVDAIGFTKKSTFKGMYSHSFALNSETSMFALGLSGGIAQSTIDHNKVVMVDDVVNTDIVTYYVEDDGIKPDIDFGLTYSYRPGSYNALEDREPLLQIGASVTHINQIFNADSRANCNYYAYAMFNFPLGNMRFNPGLSLVHRSNITSAELNAMLSSRRLWFGASLKFRGNEIALFGGINISDYIGIGYSSDFTYSSVGNQSRSSHEVFLILRFPNEHDYNCSSYRQGAKKRKFNEMFNNFIM